MTHFCIFLRGVNVNGQRLKMAELSKALMSMNYLNVKTILASGNVIVSSDDTSLSLQDHKVKIETELSHYFAYQAYIIIKDLTDIEAILADSKQHPVPENYHHYILLTNDNTLASELVDEFSNMPKLPLETLIVEASGTYWIISKGDTLNSEFGKKILSKKAYKSRLTSRNINTIQKVYTHLSNR